MESKHVIQAFQETLADLPPVEQTLKTLQFTERIDELEASEREQPRYASVNIRQGRESITRPDRATPPGRETVSRSGEGAFPSDEDAFPGDEDAFPSREDLRWGTRRRSRVAEPQLQRLHLIAILGIAGLVLLIVIIMGLCAIFGGNKPIEVDDPAGPPIESEPGYAEGTSAGDKPSYSGGTSIESGYDDAGGMPAESEPDDATPAEPEEEPKSGSRTDFPQD